MGYLVIQNENTKKSYQLTNVCNKPRIKVSNSYIPLTNNNKTGLRCKVTNSNIAEYLSYTSTSNKRTITTGTTYLTRSSTSETVYQTKSSSSYWKSTSKLNSYYTTYTTDYFLAQESKYYRSYLENCNKEFSTMSIEWHRYVTFTGNSYSTSSNTTGTMYYSTYNIASVTRYWRNGDRCTVTISSNGYKYSTYYSLGHITTGTSYNTRSSTSGTNYGTTTTNDTYTSSSWQ